MMNRFHASFRPLTLLTVCIALCGTDAAKAEAEYPKKIQARLKTALEEGARERLQGVFKTLQNETPEESVESLIKNAKKAGIGDAELKALREYASVASPAPTWNGREISIRDEGNEITVGPEELLDGTIRVNGKSFRWDKKESVPANLTRYESLFKGKKSKSAFLLDAFISSAQADELMQIRGGGIRLYFEIRSIGEQGEQLYRLNTKVKGMLEDCLHPPKANAIDRFSAGIADGALVSSKYPQAISLQDCDGITTYARIRSARLPNDLCKNIAALVKCTQAQVDPEIVSDGVRKALKEEPNHWNSSPPLPKKETGKGN